MTLRGNPRYGQQIILNIGLFIPLGYYLADLLGDRYNVLKVILCSILISVMIEAIQYLSFRGQSDVDDLVSNTLGGIIGFLLHKVFCKIRVRGMIPYLMLFVGLCGCMYTVEHKQEVDNTIYFNFQIQSVHNDEGKLELLGCCYKYADESTDYEMVLKSDLDTHRMDLVVDGKNFSASADAQPGKYEIWIHFAGDKEMSAGTYVRINEKDACIEYIPEDVTIPEGVPETAVLKAFNKLYDTYVFENEGMILWLIGRQDLDRNTEIIYHIHTDEPEKLPDNRLQYGFDNRGFRAKKNERHGCEVEPIGHYRVFEKAIPSEYRVSSIIVGFSTDKTIEWTSGFRVSQKTQ